MNSKVEMSPVKVEDECLQNMIENRVCRIGKKRNTSSSSSCTFSVLEFFNRTGCRERSTGRN